MKMNQNRVSTFGSLLVCATLILGTAAPAAENESPAKTDPSGTWTWVMPSRSGGADRTNRLTLKMEGEKLTGTLTSPARGGGTTDTAIADGKVAGDQLSFTVTREFNDNKFVSKYSGKVSGDTLKGKIEFDRGGEPVSRDWEAKRETTAKK